MVRTEWRQAEFSTAYALRHRGVRCSNVGHKYLPWDVETRSGIKIEVKDSTLHRGCWVVNLRRRHRRTRSKGKPDFIVVSLRGLEGFKGVTKRLWVVLDAKKFRKQTLLRWTLRSLLTLHARDIGDWEKLLKVERRKHVPTRG